MRTWERLSKLYFEVDLRFSPTWLPPFGNLSSPPSHLSTTMTLKSNLSQYLTSQESWTGLVWPSTVYSWLYCWFPLLGRLPVCRFTHQSYSGCPKFYPKGWRRCWEHLFCSLWSFIGTSKDDSLIAFCMEGDFHSFSWSHFTFHLLNSKTLNHL